MKITEKLPYLLQIIYDNCKTDLSLYFEFTKDANVVAYTDDIHHNVKNDIVTTLKPDEFFKCYFYMLSAGYIEEASKTMEFSKRNPKLTAKGIDFFENYSFSQSSGIE